MVNLKSYILFIIAIVFIAFTLFYSHIVPPKGDEVHYLITATSITKDKDIWLENNYPPVLDRHTITRPDGHDYLYHGLGLFPFLISPGFAILGRFGSVLTITLLSILLIIQMFKFLSETSKSKNIALIVTAIASFSLPLANYYLLLFPEIAGALLILVTVRYFFKSQYNELLVFSLIGLLPWIHIRFLPIALVLLIFWIFKSHSLKAIISIILFTLYFVFLYIIYGSIDPTYPYQVLGIKTDSGNFLMNIISVLIDRQYGLLIYSPIFILIFPGFIFWYKKNRTQALFVLILLTMYSIGVFRYYDWHGGYSPPARYLTAVTPLLLPMVAIFIKESKNFLSLIIILIFSTWGIAAFLLNLLTPPNYGFVFKDGISPYLIHLNTLTGVNIHGLFPAFYPNQMFTTLHLIWIVIIFLFILFLLKINKET
jgi:hypothetical protein